MARHRRLGELLREAGLIAEFQLNTALGEQTRYGARIGRALIQLGYVEEAAIVETLARQLGVPVARLEGRRIEPDVLALLGPVLAEKHACLPLFTRTERRERVLYLAMEDPTDLRVVDELAFRIGMRVTPVIAGPSALRRAQRACWPEHDFPEEDGRERKDPPPVVDASAPCVGPDALAYYPLSPPIPFDAVPEEPEPDAPAPVAAPEPAPASQEEPAAIPGFEATSLELAASAPRSAAPGIEASASEMVRALVQVLTEKGLIDREDLAVALDRVRGPRR